jgi:hypothetical protein
MAPRHDRRRRGRLPVVLAAGALVAGAAGLALHLRRPPRPAGRGGRLGTAAALLPGFDGARHGCRFQVGETLGYSIDVRTDATVDPQRAGLGAGRGNGPVQVHKAVRTDLQLKTLTVDADKGAVLLAAYRNMQGDTEAPNLAAPFLLRVDPACRIAGYARFDKTPSAYGRTQQAIAHELAWRWTEGDATVDEASENGIGAYVARHAAVDGTDGPRVERTVLTYTALWSSGQAPGGGGRAAPAVPRGSSLVVDPGDGAWFQSMRGDETLQGISATDSHTVLAVARIAPEPRAFDAASIDQKRYVWEDLLPRTFMLRALPEVTQRDLRQRDAMRGLTLDQALAAFLRRVKSGQNFSETWPELKVYLEARPEMARELMRRLRANELPPEAEAAAFLALGKAMTPEAREALLATMRDSSAEVIDRSRSLFALVDRPDVDVSLAREMATNALAIDSGGSRAERIYARESALAVGMMAGLRGDTEPDIKAVAVAAVPQLLALGDTATSLSPAFGAIGNIGDPAMLAYVSPYTESPDAAVREVAARSVRRMAPQETGDFEAAWLQRETDPNVKRELYSTISKQSYDAQQPVAAGVVQRAIADLQSNPGLLTRKAIIQILGPLAATDPQAKAALMNQIAYETKQSSGLYSVIAGYLSPADVAAAVGL